MGCGGSKVADAVESSGSSSPSGGGNAGDDIETVQGSGRVRTFRERRLSMSQQQHTNARPRRRSIYGNDGDTDMQPSAGQSPCSTCGCRTMGGLEPAPGGLVAKTNQDRGLAIYPWDNVQRLLRQQKLHQTDTVVGYMMLGQIVSVTEIVEATEVAPDTVVGHMMLGQIVSVTSRDLGHHVGT